MNPQKLTNAAGAIVWDRVAEPFGVEISATGSLTQPLRFPGQRHDSETGFSQNRHRDYDPFLGRYMQSDPIGLMGGVNTYAYVGGNPLTLTDLQGLAVGLHYVPWEVFRNAGLPAQAYNVFKTTTTGPLPGGHGNSGPHVQYNKAVGEAFDKYLKQNQINPSKMTEQQARDFLDELSRSKDPRIRNFIKDLEKQLGKSLLRRGGGFICRRVPALFFGLEYFQEVIQPIWMSSPCGECEA